MGCDRSHLLSMTASLQSGPEILIPNTGIAAASMPDKRYSAKVDFESKECFVFDSELVCLYWACFLGLFCTPLFVPEQVSPGLANFGGCQLCLCLFKDVVHICRQKQAMGKK